jgi:ABC-type Na+ efflux pump permease subunit
LVRGSAIIDATAADGPVMLAYAIMSLAMGIAIVLGHNVWSGGVLPVVVTLVGWLIFAKGLLLLFLAPEALSRMFEQMRYAEHYYLFLAPALVIGLYLTWAGFTAPDSREL